MLQTAGKSSLRPDNQKKQPKIRLLLAITWYNQKPQQGQEDDNSNTTRIGNSAFNVLQALCKQREEQYRVQKKRKNSKESKKTIQHATAKKELSGANNMEIGDSTLQMLHASCKELCQHLIAKAAKTCRKRSKKQRSRVQQTSFGGEEAARGL